MTVPPMRFAVRLSPSPVSFSPSQSPQMTCRPLQADPPTQQPRLVHEDQTHKISMQFYKVALRKLSVGFYTKAL